MPVQEQDKSQGGEEPAENEKISADRNQAKLVQLVEVSHTQG